MTISFSANRVKLDTTVPLSGSFEVKTPVESGTKIRIPVCVNNFVQDATGWITNVSITTGSDIVTYTNTPNAMSNLFKIGDILDWDNGTSDFASGTYVLAFPTSTTMRVSTNALRTGTTDVMATSKTFDATVYIIEIDNSVAGMNLKVSPKIYVFDGKRAYVAAGTGTYDNATVSDGTAISLAATDINLETFYSNARQAKVNS